MSFTRPTVIALLLSFCLCVRPTIADNYIVGGSEAQAGDFPWYALLLYGYSDCDNDVNRCGGALIGPQHVLTAASCISGGIFPRRVKIGATTATTDGVAVMANLAWSPPNHEFQQFPDDIAILQLTEPVTDVTPIQLNSNPNRIVQDRQATVMGFGATQNKPNTGSNNLQKLNYNVTSVAQCQDSYGDQVEIGKNFCTQSGGCYWDMGAPLIDQSDGVLLGVLTSGFGCGVDAKPDVYANVASYYDAIQNCLQLGDCNFDAEQSSGCNFQDNPLQWLKQAAAVLWTRSWW